jgi:hypothetical protein
MRKRLSLWLASAWRKLNPRNPIPQLQGENRALTKALSESQAREAHQRDEAHRFLAEMVEAQAMCGAGPWAPGGVMGVEAHAAKLQAAGVELREAGPVGDISPTGAYGLYELLLQNVNWQREINYSWLEFTRWGIQQIILICRLYYIKNPIVRRLVDVCAQYVFARGFDCTTNDDTANEVIKDFFTRNQKVIGHVALMESEKSKDRDGNLFWALFTAPGTGLCNIRMIDATEIQDVWCDPDDADIPQYYQRIWTERQHDVETGQQATVSRQAWYPALNYEPSEKPPQINGHDVMWNSPVYHRKVGQVGKWLFGCPRIYPMLDWAKEGRRFLEACASVRQSLSQYAFLITTKGGQQGIEGIKQQMQTQVGPGAPIWDPNPPAIAGATWVSGPGTTLAPLKGVQGATFSPDDVRWYVIMCCMVKGLPPTFLGDMQTSNLATATSLDRPTETVFLSLQEEWTEDFEILLTYVLSKSLKAPGGKLREACANPGALTIRPAERVRMPSGRWRYAEAKSGSDDIEVKVIWPSIREGDTPSIVKAIVESMTLDNKGGQIVGIDEAVGVGLLYEALDVEDGQEHVAEQYPDKPGGKGAGAYKAYDPNRMVQQLHPPIQKLQPQPGVQPEPGAASATVATQTGVQPPAPAGGMKEAVRQGFARLAEAIGSTLDNSTDSGDSPHSEER